MKGLGVFLLLFFNSFFKKKEITARLYAKGKDLVERKQFVMHERKAGAMSSRK